MPSISDIAAPRVSLFGGSAGTGAPCVASPATDPGGASSSDRISIAARVERGVHLAGSLSMIAMTPLMLGMMLVPRHAAKPPRGEGAPPS